MVSNENAIWSPVLEVKTKQKIIVTANGIVTQATQRSCPRGLDCMKLFQYSLIQPLSLAPSVHWVYRSCRLLNQKLTTRRYGRLFHCLCNQSF